jgi:hypothetical protein
MRAGNRCVAFMLIVASATGCATQSIAPPRVVLRVVDGPVWLFAEEIERFRCEQGSLICDSADGRVAQRRCRCL